MTKTQAVTNLTDQSFRETLKTETQPIFVDFYADWCGPCIAAAPIIEKLADEYKGKVLIAKLNVDEHPQVAQEYGVMSIPTVIVFKPSADEAKILGKQVGFLGETGYRNLIDEALKS